MEGELIWRSFLLTILVLLSTSLLVSCFGLEVVDQESELEQYENKAETILNEWKATIDDWETKANDQERSLIRDLDAEDCYHRMETVTSAWDALDPPNEFKEYHLWMGHAMGYEKEAFRIMAEYYQLDEDADSEDFDRLRNLAVELWVLKDEALLKAEDAYPE